MRDNDIANQQLVKDVMKRKRISILVLFLILAVAFSAAVFSACNDNTTPVTEGETIEATEGLLISNSDFKVIGTGGDYPHTVTDWTGAKLYSSSTVPGDVISGAISLDEALYSAGRELWNDNGNADADGKTLYQRLIAEGGQGGHYSDAEDAVNNILMIHMPTTDMAESEDDDYGPTAYGYTSKSFSLDAASYYKLSVDVLTYNIAGTDDEDNVPGARIYIASAGYAEISGIDTQGEWRTYTIYIESAATSSTSLTLNLGLGKYSSYYRDGLTTGYAFFDNVVLEKLADTDDKTAQEQYEDGVAEELLEYEAIAQDYADKNATADDEEADTRSLAALYSAMSTRTMSLLVPNGRFDYGSTTIGTSAPSGWSLVTGKDAPTSYRFNGVIRASLFEENYSSYAGTYFVDRVAHTPASGLSDVTALMEGRLNDSIGDSLYMLSQQMMTAQGIRTSREIVIEKNGLYAISVDVLTYNVYGGGVSLILSGDGEDIVIEGIAKNKYDGMVLFGQRPADTSVPQPEWTTYTFYIKGNQFKDMSYDLTLWLGTDSAEDNEEMTYTYYSSSSASSTGSRRTTYSANGTFSSGWAFFDDVTLKRYSADEAGDFETAIDGVFAGMELDVDGGSANAIFADLTGSSYFAEPDASYGGIAGDFRTDGTDFDFKGDTSGKPVGWTKTETSEEDHPSVVEGRVTAGTVSLTDEEYYASIGSVPGVPYDNVPDTGMTIRSTENVAFSMRSGNIDIRANSAYTISVWVKTDGVKEGTGAYLYLKSLDENDEETTLASFTAINTAEVETYNGWSEYTFYIKGSDEGREEVWLEFALGSGNRFNASSLAEGAAYFANLSMLGITYADYSDAAAGTYIKKADLSSGSKSGSFANGSFGNIDYDELEDALTASDDPSYGTLQESDVTGVPEDWTLSDAALSDNENFVGGVIKLKESTPGTWGASTQVNNLFPDNADFFTDIYAGAPDTAKGAPYLLALAGLGESFSAGYLSDSFTLDASTNYSVSVWARATEGSTGMIFLQGEASGSLVSDDEDEPIYFSVIADGKWHKYTFNIEVGLTDVSLKLGLWLGENTGITGSEEDAKDSSGIILFDSVTMSEGLTEDEIADYEPGTLNGEAFETVKRISFHTDSFDTLEGSTSSTDEDGENILSTPNGWSGAVGGSDQDRDDTISGVFNTSNPTTEVIGSDPEGGDGVSYVTGLGPDLDIDDFNASEQEVNDWLDKEGITSPTDADREEAVAAIKAEKYYEAVAARLLPGDALPMDGVDGKNVLVINNIQDSAYRYSRSDYTLTAERAYQITVRVFTYGIGHVDENGKWTAASADKDNGAYIELTLGSGSDAEKLVFDGIKTENGWVTYTFLVLAPSEDVSSVTLRLGLGIYDADDEDKLVSGYAFFDAVSVRDIGGENEFGMAVENMPGEGEEGYGTFAQCRIPEEAEQGATDSEDDSATQAPSNSFNLDALWWMVPTIVIGLAIIAVVIVYFVRKYKKKFTKKSSDDPTDSVSTSNVRKKKSDYDAFNE